MLELNNANGVDLSPEFRPMLKDLQANILKGHGRNFAHHIFLRIKQDRAKEARKWIVDFANTRITSSEKQLDDRNRHHATNEDGGPVFCLSISATGYKNLGVSENQVPSDSSFAGGLKSSAAKLADTPLKWDKPFQETVDILIIAADDNPGKARELSTEIERGVSHFAMVLINQRGKILHQILPGGDSINIENFGYADGVSQPLFLKDEINPQNASNKVWFDAEPLNLLLVPDEGGKTAESFGSYFVFRKLEQNIKQFKLNEGDIPGGTGPNSPLPPIEDASGKKNDDLPGGMIVGRFENSTPAVLSNGNAANIIHPAQITNDFDYSTDSAGSISNGSKCPFHGHTRITNPRHDVGAFAHTVRVTRRGIPYDDVKRFGEEDIIEVTDKQLDDNTPEEGVGLLFMCYQANLAKQFEFIQSTWVNKGNIGGRLVGQDGIIGQGPNTTPKTLPEKWGSPSPNQSFRFGGHVTMKGGEYFFTPSISFLTSL
jgi:Dyp-type peroxidase family